jgi:hypothetical protein
MANLGKELASLDFANLIGGPLNAIVDAQARSAIATANFVQEVGFDKRGQVRNSTFRYSKPNEDGEQEEFALTVPFIMMLPVPFVKIEEGEVEFNAKLTSTQESASSSEVGGSASMDASINYWFVKARVKASASYKKTTSSTEKVERTYEMKVRVLVKGTELPAGMERIFGMLESSMEDVPTGKLTGTLTLLADLAAGVATIDLPNNVVMKEHDVITFAAYKADDGTDVAAQDVKVTGFTAAVAASGSNAATSASVAIDALIAAQSRGTTTTWRRNRS